MGHAVTQTTDAALVPEDVRALRVQNGALRTLNRCLEAEIKQHRAKAQEYHAATTTLDSEREANRILTDTIEAQARQIEALEGALRAAFVGWIADRFQERSGVPLGRDDALKSAAGCMASFETLTSVRLGDPDHGWSEDDAHAIADDEIDTCWESAA